MSFEMHVVGAETGLQPSDILNHFKAGLVNCDSPIFSGIVYDEEGTGEYYGANYSQTYVFTPVYDSTKIILYNDTNNKGLYMPNRNGNLRTNSLIGSPAMLMRYYTWKGGAAYMFGCSDSVETQGGTTLIFVKDNLGAPLIITFGTSSASSSYNASLFKELVTSSNRLYAKYACTRGSSNDFETVAETVAFNDTRNQVVLMPFVCNPGLNETLYTPNAFIMEMSPRVTPFILDSWHYIHFNNETYLTNSFLAFREERSTSS